MKKLHTCSYWRCSHHVGLFFVLLFAVCFSWFFVRGGDVAVQSLHLDLFRLSFFGFTDMGAVSFIVGAIQSYIWAYIFIALWHLVGCCMKGGSCQRCEAKK